MKVAEIWAELGFRANNRTLGDFINSLKNLDMTMIASAAGIGGIYYALKTITDQAIETSLAIKLYTNETGLSAESMQQWTHLAEKVGISANSVTEAIKRLQLQTGLNDPTPVLDQVHEALKNLAPAEQKRFLTSMNLADVMQVLIASDKEYYGRMKDANVLSGQMNDGLNELRKNSVALGQDFRFAFDRLAAEYAPALNELVKNIGTLLEDARPHVSKFFGEAVIWCNALVLGLDNLMKHLTDIAKFVGRAGLWGLGAGFSSAASPDRGGKSGDIPGFLTGMIPNAAQTLTQSTQTINIPITVHGAAGGPASIAEEIVLQMKKAFREADDQTPWRRR